MSLIKIDTVLKFSVKEKILQAGISPIPDSRTFGEI